MDRLRNKKKSATSSGQSHSEKPPRKHSRSFTTPAIINIPAEASKTYKDEFIVSLPADFLAEEGLEGGIWPSAEKLLFPAARRRGLRGKTHKSL